LRGEQVRAGEVVLDAGQLLGPQAVGLLRSVGVERVSVHQRPRIAVVVTGSEFAQGNDPAPGQIFSSNGDMLLACLRQEGLEGSLMHAPDEAEALNNTLHEAMHKNDLVITTGGVSVGDLDLVRPTLEELGTRIVFHKVAQKPGKPMLLGRRNNTLVLGLPGNPRAVLVLFWLYVLPAIRAMQGAARPGLHNEQLPLDKAMTVKGDRAEFRAARVQGGRVSLLQDQGSHMLASLLGADALAYLPMGANSFAPGDPVLVYYLPR
jgi:molybdopterin molybdotransferase